MNLFPSTTNVTKCLLLPLCFYSLSCADHNDNRLMVTSCAALISSTEIISDENAKIFDLLESKKLDVQYAEVTSRWEPKAKRVREFSKNLIYNIHSIKDSFPFSNTSRFKNLYTEILKYQATCFEIDGDLRSQLEQKGILLCTAGGSFITENEFVNSFQSYKSKENFSTALNTIENGIVNFENLVLKFCNNYSDFIRDDFSIRFPVLVNQNTKHLKAGETLEINAGVGSFSLAAAPKIKINGKEILISDQGVTEYKVVAPNDTGKHIIPINISYTQPDGIVKSFVYQLEYFVDP